MQMEHLQCSSMLSSSRDTLSLQPGRQAGAQAAVAGGSEAAVVTPLAAYIESSTSAEHVRRLGVDSEMARRLVTALGFKADS